MKTLLISMLCVFGFVTHAQVVVNGGQLRDGTNQINSVSIVGGTSIESVPLYIVNGSGAGGVIASVENALGEPMLSVQDQNNLIVGTGISLTSVLFQRVLQAAAPASGTVTVNTNPNEGETITIGDGVVAFTATFGTDITVGADTNATATNIYSYFTNKPIIINFGVSGAVVSATNRAYGATGSSGGNSLAALSTTSANITATGFTGGLSMQTANNTTLAQALSTNATLNFGNTVAGAVTDITTTLNGVGTNSDWSIQVTASKTVMDSTAKGTFQAWVSATNTITVRFENASTGAVDPPSGGFRITATQWTP